MFSRTSEYALRAMICLARQGEDRPVPGREIAEKAGIPRKYLGKILTDLVRAGVLDSSPGKTGGFRLRSPIRQTTLLDVLGPFEQIDSGRCAFGNQECSDDNPCLAHDGWKKVIETRRKFLEGTSVFDVAVGEEP